MVGFIHAAIPALRSRAWWSTSLARGMAGMIGGLVGFTLAAGATTPRMLLLDAAVAGSDVIAVGERGTILRSTDSARTWVEIPRATRATLTGVSFAPTPPPTGARLGWAVGHEAIILATTDGGVTWSKQHQGENLQDSFLDVLAIDDAHVVAVGAYGLFVETRDAGRTWSRRTIAEGDAHLNRLSRGPTDTLYLAGETGTLLRSTDGGTTWTRLRAPYEGSFYGILPLDARTLIAYGLTGRVFRSSDDGASWQPVATPRPVLLATAVKLKGNVVVVAGYPGTLLVSRDFGRTLAPIESPTKGIAELVELPDGNVLALGETGATEIGLARINATAAPPARSTP